MEENGGFTQISINYIEPKTHTKRFVEGSVKIFDDDYFFVLISSKDKGKILVEDLIENIKFCEVYKKDEGELKGHFLPTISTMVTVKFRYVNGIVEVDGFRVLGAERVIVYLVNQLKRKKFIKRSEKVLELKK